MLRVLLATIIAALVGWAGECREVSLEGQHATLRLIATDGAGRELPNPTIELVPLCGGGKVAPDRVPYGEYRLRVGAAGFQSVSRIVRVFEPRLVLRTELAPADLSGCQWKRSAVSGRIAARPQTSTLWVKAVAVRGDESVEAPVDPQGRFLISGLRQTADYLLLVLDGSRVVNLRNIKTPAAEVVQVSIELSRQP